MNDETPRPEDAGASAGASSELLNLVSLCEQADPPEDLLDRVLAAVSQCTPPGHTTERPHTVVHAQQPHIRFRRTVSVPLAAMVGFALALLLSGIANILLLSRPPAGDEDRAELSLSAVDLFALSGSTAAPEASAVALLGPNEGVLRVHGLAPLAPGYRYVCWAVSADRVHRLAAFTVREQETSGPIEVTFTTDARVFDRVYATIETADPPPASPEGPTVLSGAAVLDGS